MGGFRYGGLFSEKGREWGAGFYYLLCVEGHDPSCDFLTFRSLIYILSIIYWYLGNSNPSVFTFTLRK